MRKWDKEGKEGNKVYVIKPAARVGSVLLGNPGAAHRTHISE